MSKFLPLLLVLLFLTACSSAELLDSDVSDTSSATLSASESSHSTTEEKESAASTVESHASEKEPNESIASENPNENSASDESSTLDFVVPEYPIDFPIRSGGAFEPSPRYEPFPPLDATLFEGLDSEPSEYQNLNEWCVTADPSDRVIPQVFFPDDPLAEALARAAADGKLLSYPQEQSVFELSDPALSLWMLHAAVERTPNMAVTYGSPQKEKATHIVEMLVLILCRVNEVLYPEDIVSAAQVEQTYETLFGVDFALEHQNVNQWIYIPEAGMYARIGMPVPGGSYSPHAQILSYEQTDEGYVAECVFTDPNRPCTKESLDEMLAGQTERWSVTLVQSAEGRWIPQQYERM